MSIYIAQKQNKKGWRFGFVKIILDFNMDDSLKFLNGIWFGSFKLKVNCRRFGKQIVSKPSVSARIGSSNESLMIAPSSAAASVPLKLRDNRS